MKFIIQQFVIPTLTTGCDDNDNKFCWHGLWCLVHPFIAHTPHHHLCQFPRLPSYWYAPRIVSTSPHTCHLCCRTWPDRRSQSLRFRHWKRMSHQQIWSYLKWLCISYIPVLLLGSALSTPWTMLGARLVWVGLVSKPHPYAWHARWLLQRCVEFELRAGTWYRRWLGEFQMQFWNSSNSRDPLS